MKSFKVSVVKMLSVLIAMLMLGTTSLLAQSYNVTFPTVSGTSGSTATQAIVMNSDLTGQSVLSFGFKMKYDPNIVEVQSIDQSGTILEGKDVLSNIDNVGGVLTVGWLSSNALAGTGPFLKVTFLFKNAGVSTLGLKAGTTFDINTITATVTPGSATTASKVISVGSSSDKKVGDFIDIPIQATTGLVTGDAINAYDFTVSYDATALEYVSVIKAGSLSAAALEPTVNALPLGTLRVAVISGTPITGTGDLIYVRMKALKKGTATFNLTQFEYNSGVPSATYINGTFSVVNSAPVLTAPVNTDQSVSEGVAISIPVTATDADGASDITYNAPTLPAGIPASAWNVATHTLNWTPGFDQSSVTAYPVVFSVTDGSGATVSVTVNITVNNVNRAPVLALNPTDLTYLKSEGQTLTIGLTGSDADVTIGDGDALTFAVSPSTVANAVLTGTGNTRTFTWPIGYDQAGSYTFTFTVTDSHGEVDTKTVNVTVSNVNNPPSFTVTGAAQMSNSSLVGGHLLTFDYKAIDPEGSAVSYTYTVTPAVTGAAVNPTTGVFTWTPAASTSGSYQVVVFASDGVNTTPSSIATVTVTPNSKPVIAAIAEQTATENVALGFTVSATDANSDAIAYSYTVSPAIATNVPTLDAATGVFAWTPSYTQAGTYTFTISASDGIESTTATVSVVVADVNRTPVLAAVAAQSVDEMTALSIQLAATDEDTDNTLTYAFTSVPAITSNAPVLSSTGLLTWTPNYLQAGVYTLTFTVTDNKGASATQTAVITVNNVNNAPTLTLNPVGDISVNEGTAVTVQLTGADVNTGDVLTYSYTSTPAITGATFDAATGAFAWTPATNQNGVYTVTFSVSDGALTASAGKIITVGVVNIAPTLTVNPAGPVTVNEGSATTIQLTGADVNAGTTLTYSYVSVPAATGATFNSATGAFAWTPATNQAGTYNVTFTVSDGSLTASVEKVITVVGVNIAPTLTLNPVGPNFSVNEGSALAIQLVGADVNNGTTLVYSYTSTPAATGATFNAATGAFAWTPATNQNGTYNVTFSVSDGSLTATVTSVITVINVNIAPTLTLNPVGPNFSVNEGSALAVQLVGADVNSGTTLAYSYVSTPAVTGATFNPATGAFAWTPVTNQAGTYNVTFTVSDGSLSTSVASVITVVGVNKAPTLALSPAGPYSVNEGATLTITLNGTDPNSSDVLTYSVVNPTTLPAGAALTGNVFTWTPTYDQGRALAWPFTFKVADQGGLSATKVIDITVVNVNRAPVFTTTLPVPTIVPVHKAPNPVYYRFQYVATDPDGQALTYSLTAGTANMSITTDGMFSWSPTLDQAGKSYNVTVQVTDGSLTAATSAVITASSTITAVEDLDGVPTEFSLMQNYPNPFNPTTTIRFALPNESNVRLTVFNILGQEVAALFEGHLNAGNHKVEFDASKLNSGMYLYRIEAGSFVSVKKMLLMK